MYQGDNMINWASFPRSNSTTETGLAIIDSFQQSEAKITSSEFELKSNDVLEIVASDLSKSGFFVESGKKADQLIKVPFLFGNNGSIAKSFYADAYHSEAKFVLEVEAGRAVVNNQFLKDLFQACMMQEVDYLGIAVRNIYKKRNDFDQVVNFFDTLYASSRLSLPLKGILVIGY